jgi:hypothetical protein
MWRNATSLDDENIVSMCMALNADDPGPVPVYPQQVCRTLAILAKSLIAAALWCAKLMVIQPATPC